MSLPFCAQALPDHSKMRVVPLLPSCLGEPTARIVPAPFRATLYPSQSALFVPSKSLPSCDQSVGPVGDDPDGADGDGGGGGGFGHGNVG